ncbi:sensor histidine kinase [Desulfobacula toluolica]|uniref:histidine kinase n=1 Tax=Desulfobacula toluolica (strain DSM 7467 / Tol2) TaxID=651182 RepID=K0NGB6_DESTT|nr:PAS domain S-box protein [Desulfobacula toluolica]CCK78858.1 two component system sensor histidine kinase, PAS domains [Desulfobacula toluolica Tol2]
MKNNEEYVAALENKIEKLEKQNHELNNIIFKAPIPMFVVDKTHTITHFNKALEALSGLSASDMIGTKNQWKAFYSSKRPVMADLIIDKSSDAKIIEHYGPKYNHSSKDKERFAATDFFQDLNKEGKWLFFTASPYTDDHGNIAGAVETLQDVTETKMAERKKKELYRIYRKILEFIPYPIIVYDEKGLVSYLNPSFSKTFGWSIEELKGKPVPFVPQALKAETHEMINKFETQKSLARYETKRLTREGKVLDVVLWAASHSRVKTGPTETFVILRDITEEKRLEANNKTIMRISAVLPEYPELEDLMNYISKEVKELLNTEGAVVLLYDEIKEELFFTGASYDDFDTEKRTKTIRFPVDSLLAGKIIKTGEYALVNDIEKLADNYPERDEKLGYKTKSLLEVPIKSEDRIIGVLCAINKKQNRFDYNDMELMTMIAGTVAISIENARFAEALKEAYRDVASMNRAKGKAINHLSHELRTPVAILNGSLQILKKKLESVKGIDASSTLDRIERTLNRIVDIQDEVADIMEDKTYSAQTMLLKMFEICQDELETLILENLNSDNLEQSITQLIDDKFGPRSIHYRPIVFSEYFKKLYDSLKPEFEFRPIDIEIFVDDNLPVLLLPEEILDKTIGGLVKNAIENTPDYGKIHIFIKTKDAGILFCIHDFGVGIEADARKRIFEGFFSTQETLLYSTKTPFAFNAGGKGADLLRMKIFSDRLGFTLKMESKRCRFLLENNDATCPGDIKACRFCQTRTDCLNSGYSIFKLFFPCEKK